VEYVNVLIDVKGNTAIPCDGDLFSSLVRRLHKLLESKYRLSKKNTLPHNRTRLKEDEVEDMLIEVLSAKKNDEP